MADATGGMYWGVAQCLACDWTAGHGVRCPDPPRRRWENVGEMPRNQHHPTPEERDERVKLALPPDEAIAALLETGPHPEDHDQSSEAKDRKSSAT